MKREDQLKLCEKCKNRSTDIPVGIFCNIYGDVPDFDIKCFKYEFSEKIKKDSKKRREKSKRLKEFSSPKKFSFHLLSFCFSFIVEALLDYGFFYGVLTYGAIVFISIAINYFDKTN